MALKDHLTKQAIESGSRCSVARLRATMSNDDRKAFDSAIATIRTVKESGAVVSKYTENASWLMRALEAEGMKLPMSALHKHIRKSCGCQD